MIKATLIILVCDYNTYLCKSETNNMRLAEVSVLTL